MNKKNKCQVNREKEKCLDYSHHKLFRRIEAASRILAQELAYVKEPISIRKVITPSWKLLI